MHDITLKTLPQFSQGQDWRLTLLHGRDHPLFVWITRGQGLAIVDGMRRGIGAHNALFLPAGSLFTLELGRQAFGQVLSLPRASDLRLPQAPHLLRIRDGNAQTDLTAILEAMNREQTQQRALMFEAVEAQASLVSVWLRRQLAQDEHIPAPASAAQRLTRAYFAQIAQGHTHGLPMADFATSLDVTPTHLSRVCRTATGRTAAELLNQLQLHEARRLLCDTDVAVQDIARHLGFGSAGYFARFIKLHTGQSPSQLRNIAARQHPK